MCAQCWVTASTAVGGAAGLRAWAGARRPRNLTDRRLKALTVALLVIAVLLASVRLS